MKTRSLKSSRRDKLAQLLRAREREIIVEYMARHHGHVAATANDLGLTRRSMERKMRAYGLRAQASRLREKAGIKGPRSA